MTVRELKERLNGVDDHIPVVVETSLDEDVCRRHGIEDASVLVRPCIKRMFVIVTELKPDQPINE